MISVVVPVYGALRYLEIMIASLFENTLNDFELILIDDCSPDKDTRQFIKDLKSPQVSLTKVFNKTHRWVNYNWNLGVSLAKGDYIAILNSDIKLSYKWDQALIHALNFSTIACPFETNPTAKEPFALSPFFKKNMPNMIKGSCFMFRKDSVPFLFPIPSQIKHWCGDNVLADRAWEDQGVTFSTHSVIHHFVSISGKSIPKSTYLKRVKKDLLEYERWSGKNMDFILKTYPFNTSK